MIWDGHHDDMGHLFPFDIPDHPLRVEAGDLQSLPPCSMHGYVERLGVRLIDIRAVLDKDLGPGTASGANFNIKATPAADKQKL